MQRFKLGLLKYDIGLRFLPGKKNLLADPLSRLNIKNIKDSKCDKIVHKEVIIAPEKLFLIFLKKQNKIKDKTKENKCLSKFLDLYVNEWKLRKCNIN